MSNSAKTMAELLAKQKTTFVPLHKGEIVKATVSKVTPSEILLEVGSKTEAVVLEKDRHIMKHLVSLLKVGDEVSTMVLNPESDEGYPMVSLRRFATDKKWVLLSELLKSQEKLDVEVTQAIKGGFLVVSSTGVEGFLPNSHLSSTPDPDDLLGKHIKTSVVEVNRSQNKVIFSEKGMLTEEQFKVQSQKLKIGQKIKSTISGITTFGLFTSLSVDGLTLDGLIHISEVSWVRTTDLSGMFNIGQEVEVVVIGFDKDAKRIDLSIKRLTEDPFKKVTQNYPVDKKVSGEVAAITDLGVEVLLPEVDGIKGEGLIRKDKISPTTKYEVGQSIQATVIGSDIRKRKILLTPILKEKPLMYR